MNINHDWAKFIETLASSYPKAYAYLYGDQQHNTIYGTILFFSIWNGTLVLSTIDGLPYDSSTPCENRMFAFHIHEGATCTGTESDPFADTGLHYNPNNCDHPEHAGDMPPLFGNLGYAFQLFYTERFLPEDVVGHTCILHEAPDDFTTQPSGNSGKKIASGEIKNILP